MNKNVEELYNLLQSITAQVRDLDVSKLSEAEKAELKNEIFVLMDELEQFEDELRSKFDGCDPE